MNNFFAILTWPDYVIIAIISLSTLISLMRGFVKEAISLMTWITAVIVSLKFSKPLAESMTDIISTPSIRTILSVVFLFLAVLILGGLVNFLVNQIVSKGGLSIVNRLIGSVFGFARGVLVIGLIVFAVQKTAITEESWWHSAQLIKQFEGIANTIGTLMPEYISKASESITPTQEG